MRKLIFPLAQAAMAVLLFAGCVQTVNDRTTPGVPLVKDTIRARYERPVNDIFEAAKSVVEKDGTLLIESTLHQTNEVKIVEGRVNQRKVWIRIEALDPKVSEVTVQTRTSGGGSDVDLAAQLDKEIALKLTAPR
jgi:hypothetical protein